MALSKVKKIAEGKTKIVYEHPVNPHLVLIKSKDDITAGDGAKKDCFDGKAVFSTETICNCFKLLNLRGLPTHYLGQIEPKIFLARKAKMIPLELVVRRIATGSYLKRSPEIAEGTVFNSLVFEVFLKNDETHDPLVVYDFTNEISLLYDPKKPLSNGFFQKRSLEEGGILMTPYLLNDLRDLAVKTFEILEGAWAKQNVSLVDLKIECGFDEETGKLMIADVIDNDSWRIWPAGDKTQMKDKQVYRDLPTMTPEARELLKKNYQWVAKATSSFC